MGGALAILAAATVPKRISALVLLAPAGLPLEKPVTNSLRNFVAQAAAGRYRLRDVVSSATELAASPRASVRLVRELRQLDLSAEMIRVREAGVRTTVIGCATDTLVTPDQCRRTARLLAASYRELSFDGGHVWMFGRWHRLARELARPEAISGLSRSAPPAHGDLMPASRPPHAGAVA